jgi:hypothetical protein
MPIIDNWNSHPLERLMRCHLFHHSLLLTASDWSQCLCWNTDGTPVPSPLGVKELPSLPELASNVTMRSTSRVSTLSTTSASSLLSKSQIGHPSGGGLSGRKSGGSDVLDIVTSLTCNDLWHLRINYFNTANPMKSALLIHYRTCRTLLLLLLTLIEN